MFKLLKSNAFKKGSLYLGVFAASVAATFYISKAANSSSVPSTDVNGNIGNLDMTPGDKLINSVMSYEAINLDGGSSTAMYIQGNTINGTNLQGVKISNALSIIQVN